MGTTPRKVDIALQFVDAFGLMLRGWPREVKLLPMQISEHTRCQLPHVIELLSEGLSRQPEVHDYLSMREAERALGNLKDRYRADMEARDRRNRERREQVEQTLGQTMQKVHAFEVEKNVYSAYRTLSYFASLHSGDLSRGSLLSVCGECLRLGIKARVNFQELAQWLQKAMDLLLVDLDPSAMEDALDFIEAYAEHFLISEGERGVRFIGSLLNGLAMPAAEMGLTDKFNQISLDAAQRIQEVLEA